MKPEYLEQRLLIAMPSMSDPNFRHGVTLLCQHNDEGALGINIHQSSSMRVGEVLAQLDLQCDDDIIVNMPVLTGGPVQPERGFVLHNGRLQGQPHTWESSLQLHADLLLSTSRDILVDIAHGRGPDQFLIALGYSGWGAGQLEAELLENAWLNAQLDSELIFNSPPGERWRKALDSIGVHHPDQISWTAGHA
ncbi:MAG: YqgE/AlgH family protein [Gammaproteobacteria bacterium]|jgi:putative transcriptional regulator|nr:YqgE/AlgH family protein [Gammaproteobacteria bacterium]